MLPQACSTPNPPVAIQPPDAGPTPLAVACDDSVASIYGDPGPLGASAGTILKCAKDRAWSKSALESFAREDTFPYVGRPFVSGATVYRVTYRTERGDAAHTPGSTSALFFLPDAPAPNAPAIVVARGTSGQAGRCASSTDKFVEKGDQYAAMIFPLVGAGYPVIVPDLAGYANYGANGNPPSGYAASADVAKSTLDGFRALRRLAPSIASSKSILVGHSQGGHSALSALALSESYGVPVSGVVTYSPLWFNQASWAALLFVADQFPIETNAFTVGIGVWYHYSHGELLDGHGHGVDVFAPGKREAIKQFFDTACGQDTAQLKNLGTLPTDLYDPAFIASVSAPAALGAVCPEGDALCAKWIARYAGDRPHLEGAAKSVPLLVVYGGRDDTIPPSRAVCGFDRLHADGANVTVCLEPNGTHASVLGLRSGYVNDWVASVALGAPAPVPCAQDEASIRDDAGARIACATPPPND